MLMPAVVELKEPALVQQVTQVAETQKRLPEGLLATVVRDYLEALEEEAIPKETEAFWREHEALLAQCVSRRCSISLLSNCLHD